MRHYIGLTRKEGDSDFGVSFPDLPGCVTAGTTLEEARGFAEEALALHLQGLAEDKDALPEPSSLDVVMQDEDSRDGVAILVPVPITSRAVRVNITLPADLLERIDSVAESRGMNRSGFLAQAARREMETA